MQISKEKTTLKLKTVSLPIFIPSKSRGEDQTHGDHKYHNKTCQTDDNYCPGCYRHFSDYITLGRMLLYTWLVETIWG